MLEVLKESSSPVYSLFIPFTREWLVEEFLEHLDKFDMPPLSQIEFVFYNDTDNRSLQSILRSYLEGKLDSLNGAKIYMSNNREPTETDADVRRARIVTMKNESRRLIADSKFVICIEDDTFVDDTGAIMKLVEYISTNDRIGFVSGVERGRWGFSIIGAWTMDNPKDPHRVSTLPYRESGLQEVDGAGWYFYITRTEQYKVANYRFDGECLGPDVCYVMDLRRMDYICYVDWSIVCGHRHGSATLYPDANCMIVSWMKTDNGWSIISAG